MTDKEILDAIDRVMDRLLDKIENGKYRDKEKEYQLTWMLCGAGCIRAEMNREIKNRKNTKNSCK